MSKLRGMREVLRRKKKEEGMPTDSCMKCQSCGGHPTFKCRKSTRACFRCGNKNYFVKDCPMIPKLDSNSRPQTQTRVFSLSDSIVTGTIYISGLPAQVLFDSGSTYSFILPEFATSAKNSSKMLDTPYTVNTASGKFFASRIIYPNCEIYIGDHVFPANLIALAIKDIDILLGMD
ncbi:hypothetical protein AXF42_Ash013170 [Apostasia shenzhenica]|uniref:CCHC-type domain-containing protein n=1 Tax=Apostasia shenzhenica TaxID=1088818 RepID=A0A2I0BD96_9ASPA|nr:hypothetical protein AXF42_Ash013170 [Apostasia shenzhenica]